MVGFPLPWERVQYRSRRYAVSDFRFVLLRRGGVTLEVALDDVSGIDVEPSRLERLTGAGVLVVRGPGGRPVARVFVTHARRRAGHLTLLLADIRGVPPGDDIATYPLPKAWRIPSTNRLQTALVAPGVVLLAVTGIVIALNGHEMRVVYGPDDTVRPGGVPRSREAIVAFMEQEVMPFARTALEPVVGTGNVRCETCHGEDAAARDWQMPAVAALPEPVALRMADTAGSDSQVRNALHGYSASESKQATATHMRGVVVPGMARLLRRPAYDFAQSYEYNRTRAALGCYHCHMVPGAADKRARRRAQG